MSTITVEVTVTVDRNDGGRSTVTVPLTATYLTKLRAGQRDKAHGALDAALDASETHRLDDAETRRA